MMDERQHDGATRPAKVPTITPVDLGALTTVTWRVTLRRLGQITVAFVRHILPVLVRRPFVKDSVKRQQQLGEGLYRMICDLGATFVKLGQILASAPSVSGEVLANSLRGVLDAGPAIPFDDVRRIVEADTGRRIEATFASFDRTPFAAASLAVVHRATLLDGTEVAVKVLRPQTAAVVAADLSIVQPLVRALANTLPVGAFLMIPGIIADLAEQLTEELDLRNEASVMGWFADLTAFMGVTKVIVPATFPAASGPNVLTMAFVHGSKIDDLDQLTETAIDARTAVENLIETWFALTLCTGVFHGDMHAGNLLLTEAGEVVLLDWGIVGRLPEASRRFFRRSLEGALGDETAWPEVRDHFLQHIEPEMLAMAGFTPDDFMALIRSQTMMIMTQPFSELNLMMLMPTSNPMEDGAAAAPKPSGAREWLKVVREERAKIPAGMKAVDVMQSTSPPRGEVLLIKQLIFVERYGKLFLGDQPLIYDPEVYRSLLALPDLDPATEPA